MDAQPHSHWEIDITTASSVLFDVVCFAVCLYTLATQILQLSTAQSSAKSPTSSGVASGVATREYSVWKNKRRLPMLTATLATLLWHAGRLSLVVILSLEAIRTRQPPAGATEEDEYAYEERSNNPFLRPPAVYIVLALPAFTLVSRTSIIALFAFQKSHKWHQETTAHKKGSTQRRRSTSHGTEAAETAVAGKTSRIFDRVMQYIVDLRLRLYGPTQNLYLVAFYLCTGLAIMFVPFTYNLIWYLDTPRLEFMSTLYLAGIVSDASLFSSSEKRRRGITHLRNLVNIRWFALGLMFFRLGHDVVWRFLLDGTAVQLLWKLHA